MRFVGRGSSLGLATFMVSILIVVTYARSDPIDGCHGGGSVLCSFVGKSHLLACG